MHGKLGRLAGNPTFEQLVLCGSYPVDWLQDQTKKSNYVVQVELRDNPLFRTDLCTGREKGTLSLDLHLSGVGIFSLLGSVLKGAIKASTFGFP